ncbi:hypothetical protein ANCCEY_04062 [Ancylostoma ceylanicum]|uniref:Elongator complex protein 6 n=2 Tax=Ancylostoma ceylanicum TaxID=53326 RepID=A0A0D6LXT6_9BILA|nr:hypothetical protein ANCCEY_04062 [Ancylostoma ceylanicum]EYC44519.1 hypothetical protein Y032_0459g1844 [Ancylostoma ceylanicum]
MLDLLSKQAGTDVGIGVASYSGSSSDLFLQLHYCSIFFARKKRVLIISSNLTESHYRLIFGKLAMRWDPSLISVVELDSLLGNDFKIDGDRVVKELTEVFSGESTPSLLILEDVGVLERLGIEPSAIVCLLHRLYSRLGPDGLLLASFSIKTKTYNMMVNKADFTIDITPVGLGFGKDVTGKMEISVRRAAPMPTTAQLLYLTGDRSIKCFYPGGNTFLNI